MIANFPTPFPDELFYSICARYAYRSAFPSIKQVPLSLFGKKSALAVIDLPSHLAHFAKQLPETHSLKSPQFVIDWHTQMPYYLPFRSEQQRAKALSFSLEQGSVHGALGLMAHRIKHATHLLFCPICAKRDADHYGEGYWHRTHQLPGVRVCPEHAVFLQASSAQIRQQRTRHVFAYTPHHITPQVAQPLNLSWPLHQALHRLACISKWLLDHPTLPSLTDNINQEIRVRLPERALSSYRGQMKVQALGQKFIEYYGATFLQEMRCLFNPSHPHHWLAQLIRRPQVHQHPLHYLLLSIFLDINLEAIPSSKASTSFFGKPSWPCLNPTCKHYHHEVIHQHDISFTKDHGKPVATFECLCGFSYCRTGPDKAQQDRYRRDGIIAYGPVWMAHLEQLWLKPDISLRRLAQRLGVDTQTARKQAIALGLPAIRPGGRTATPKIRLKSIRQNRYLSESTIQQKQQLWIGLQQELPNTSISSLRSKHPRLYYWLYRHCPGWLKSHASQQGKTISPKRVNWSDRDRLFASQVAQAALQLKQSRQRPTRITLASIARQIGQLSLIQKNLHHLPLTQQQIDIHRESRANFAVRRVEWVVAQLKSKKQTVPIWQIARLAGLRSDLLENHAVHNALNLGYNQLQIEITRHAS